MDVDLDFGRVERLITAACISIAAGWPGSRYAVDPHLRRARRDTVRTGHGGCTATTNILRDIGEDADEDRLYLPMDMIRKEGIEATDPQEIVRDARFRPVCEAIAEEAAARFRDSDELLKDFDRKKLKPALIMGAVYRGYLDKLMARGFYSPTEPVKLSKAAKLSRALRALIR